MRPVQPGKRSVSSSRAEIRRLACCGSSRTRWVFHCEASYAIDTGRGRGFTSNAAHVLCQVHNSQNLLPEPLQEKNLRRNKKRNICHRFFSSPWTRPVRTHPGSPESSSRRKTARPAESHPRGAPSESKARLKLPNVKRGAKQICRRRKSKCRRRKSQYYHCRKKSDLNTPST